MALNASALSRSLRRRLPEEIAEILMPCITFRVGKRQVTAILPNPLWVDCFGRFAQNIVTELIARDKMLLVVRSAIDAEAETGARLQDFSTFLRDPGNEFALTASKRVVESPGLEHNPLYLHGPIGSGKTHLLRAIAAEYRAMLGKESIVVVSGDEFVGRWTTELAQRRSGGLRDRLAQAALVALDGIEALGNRALAQEELFHLFNACLDAGQQIVVTGISPPQRLKGIETRLSTRLSWGLAVALEAPQMETRLALLRQRCGSALDDLELSALPSVLEAQTPNMHSVVELGERILRGEDPTQVVGDASFDQILSQVAKHAGLRPGDIIGKRRSRDIAQARQTALLLARRLTGHKLESLGALVGGRDHSTVIYSLRQAEERMRNDQQYAETVRLLTQRVLDER